MSKKSIRQDLILKGLDPNNVVVGTDGLFVAKTEPVPDTIEEKPSKNAFVMLSEISLGNDGEAKTEEPQVSKNKKKSKSE